MYSCMYYLDKMIPGVSKPWLLDTSPPLHTNYQHSLNLSVYLILTETVSYFFF